MDSERCSKKLAEFKAECRERLQVIEPDLAYLINIPVAESRPFWEEVRQALRKIENTAARREAAEVAALARRLADHTAKILNRPGKCPPEDAKTLISGLTNLGELVGGLGCGSGVSGDSGCGEALKPAGPMGGGGEFVELIVAGGPPGASDRFYCDADKWSQVLAGDRRLFAFWAHQKNDIDKRRLGKADLRSNLDSLGMVLFLDSDEHGWLRGLMISIIDSPELAGLSMEIPPGQVVMIPQGRLQTARPGSPLKIGRENTRMRDSGGRPAPDFAERAADKGPDEKPPSGAPPPSAVSPAPVTPPHHSPGKAASKNSPASIRVSVPLVDGIIGLTGELVLGRNRLKRLTEERGSSPWDLGTAVKAMDQVTSELQDRIMRLRMQPLGVLFNKLPRLARSLQQEGKKFKLVIKGGEVELDRSVLERLSDPLTHLLRNSVDHGLETGSERLRAGKKDKGVISITASQDQGMVVIRIEDDGRGIDPEKVADRAVAEGIIRESQRKRLTRNEKLMLVTAPGLSTAKTVTDLSGRGVGMDVVRNNIEKLNGQVIIHSMPGDGAVIELRLPLTLAIIPALTVGAGGMVFAIPRADIQELVGVRNRETGSRIERLGQAAVLRLRNSLVPLLRLDKALGLEGRYVDFRSGALRPNRRKILYDRRAPDQDPSGPPPDEGGNKRSCDERRHMSGGDVSVVVLKVGDNRYGLMVDQLFDHEEIVVKPLSRHIGNSRCFQGVTIMGDGRVALILDGSGLADEAGLTFGEIKAEENRRLDEVRRVEKALGADRPQVVQFAQGANSYFAVPLGKVTRLIRISPGDVQMLGGRECIQQEGLSLPLIRLEHDKAKKAAPGSEELFVLVLGKSPGRAGIAATRILDIAPVPEALEEYRGGRAGVGGVGVINGNLTMLLNPEELGADLMPSTPGA